MLHLYAPLASKKAAGERREGYPGDRGGTERTRHPHGAGGLWHPTTVQNLMQQGAD